MALTDLAAERAVLAGIYKYGGELYLDICDIVKPSTFTIDSNKMIFHCLKTACEQDENVKFDIPTILSTAKNLNYNHILERKEELSHLNSIIQLSTEKTNVRKFAAKLRKLEIARLIHDQMGVGQEKMMGVTGTEPVASIIGMAEEIVFDFSSLLDNENSAHAVLVGKGIMEYLDYLEKNPVDQIGISTCFPRWDASIGGGLRPGVSVIAARPKAGKSMCAANMSLKIAQDGIPALNIDTEMCLEDQQHRALAILSGVDINDVETGKFGQFQEKKVATRSAGEILAKIPYHYKAVAGQQFEDTLAMMRRWIQKDVGLKADGTANPCVIFFDYLKLLDGAGVSESMKEYQILGFMITALHNFAARYKVPIVAFIQLNRDGIDKETTGAVSGSDRIIWLCTNFSILKKKSDEEIAEDGKEAGSRKLKTLVARHGEAMETGDYVNIRAKMSCGRMQEGLTKFEIEQGKTDNGPQLLQDDGKEIPFD